MANKMTQRDYYNAIIALAEENGRQDLVDFAKGRIEVLNRKSDNKKATKTQEENEILKAEILSIVSDEKQTITDIQNKSEKLAGLSNQKISALLRQLKEAGKVDKIMDKKKAYFVAV